MYCYRFGGFCTEVDRFDATLFRLSPADAAAIDPQQRMLMEQSFLALQDAEQRVGQAVATNTGAAWISKINLEYCSSSMPCSMNLL